MARSIRVMTDNYGKSVSTRAILEARLTLLVRFLIVIEVVKGSMVISKKWIFIKSLFLNSAMLCYVMLSESRCHDIQIIPGLQYLQEPFACSAIYFVLRIRSSILSLDPLKFHELSNSKAKKGSSWQKQTLSSHRVKPMKGGLNCWQRRLKSSCHGAKCHVRHLLSISSKHQIIRLLGEILVFYETVFGRKHIFFYTAFGRGNHTLKNIFFVLNFQRKVKRESQMPFAYWFLNTI